MATTNDTWEAIISEENGLNSFLTPFSQLFSTGRIWKLFWIENERAKLWFSEKVVHMQEHANVWCKIEPNEFFKPSTKWLTITSVFTSSPSSLGFSTGFSLSLTLGFVTTLIPPTCFNKNWIGSLIQEADAVLILLWENTFWAGACPPFRSLTATSLILAGFLWCSEKILAYNYIHSYFCFPFAHNLTCYWYTACITDLVQLDQSAEMVQTKIVIAQCTCFQEDNNQELWTGVLGPDSTESCWYVNLMVSDMSLKEKCGLYSGQYIFILTYKTTILQLQMNFEICDCFAACIFWPQFIVKSS